MTTIFASAAMAHVVASGPSTSSPHVGALFLLALIACTVLIVEYLD